MIKTFKSHFALIPIIFIAILMIILRIDIIYNQFSVNLWQSENLAPFSKMYVYLLGNLLLNNYYNLFFSALLVFFQSGIIISIFGYFKDKDLKSFLPAWLFVLLMHSFPNLLYLSPQLFSLTFILLAFRKLVIFFENKKNFKEIIDLGLLLGIASMFWMPSLFFIIFAIYFLLKKQSLYLRTFLILLFSFIIPYMYVWFYYLMTNDFESIITPFYEIEFNQFSLSFYPLKLLLSTFIIFILSISSLLYVSDFLKKQLKQLQYIFNLIFFYLFNILLVLLLQNENSVSVIIFFFFPISIFLTIYFNRIKRNMLAEVIHLTLLLTIIVNFIYLTINSSVS